VKKTAIWCFISLLIILSVVLASCTNTSTSSTTTTAQIKTSSTVSTPKTTASTSATVATTKPATTATAKQANWWDKFGTPQYGGTVVWRTTAVQPTWDNNTFVGAEWQWFREALTFHDWTLDRNTYGFQGYTPAKYLKPLILESWEQTDSLTYTFHMRKGVKWQDKAPVNGREFAAYDVEYHFDRMAGTGHGFTTANPVYARQLKTWEKITALDNYTFTLKFKTLSAESVTNALNLGAFEAPEWVEKGDLQNWKNAVGTGPWMLSDYVEGSVISYAANPNYWWHDERYPNNRIPYADGAKVLIIPDISTAEAALRTGKVDMLGGESQAGLTLDQVNELTKSNPDLISATMPKNASALVLRVDKEPFSNIKVRIAMQKAIDLQSIAKNFYKGQVDGAPVGIIHPSLKGFAYAYADWPQSLKDEYSYDVTAARQLLTDAGYPNGFKTDVVSPANNDINLLQIIKANFAEVGIQMEISTMDFGAFSSMGTSGKINQMAYWYAGNVGIYYNDLISTSTQNFGKANDTTYDKLANDLMTAKTDDEYQKAALAADKRVLEQHYYVTSCNSVVFSIWQPAFKGYSCEEIHGIYSPLFARCWKTK